MTSEFNFKNTKLERFYHFFKKGEFVKFIKDVYSLELLSEEWEKDNWNAIFKKIQ